MNVKIIIKSIAALALLNSSVQAQNNAIFYGGAGDGVSKDNHTSIYSNITVGGIGNGNSSGSFFALFTDIRKGGIGDGTSALVYATQYNDPRLGGIGDGGSALSYNSTYTDPRVGGIGDGITAVAYNSAYTDPRVGGVGDGIAAINYNSAYIDPRIGGIGDGYASVVVPAIPLNPLAINLLEFTGVKDGNTNILQWATKEDGTTQFFILEKSKNSFSWEALSGEVLAKGEDKNNYTFNDENPYQGNNFYRLRIVDTKGKFKYSNVVTLVNDGSGSISIYPNPTASELNIDLKQMKGASTIILLNSSGQIMQQIQAEQNLSTLNLDTYAAGTYMLKVINKQQQFVYKILKR
jgi:Secretion system C-terminal sorting domain